MIGKPGGGGEDPKGSVDDGFLGMVEEIAIVDEASTRTDVSGGVARIGTPGSGTEVEDHSRPNIYTDRAILEIGDRTVKFLVVLLLSNGVD